MLYRSLLSLLGLVTLSEAPVVAPARHVVGTPATTTILAGRITWRAGTTVELQGGVALAAGAELVLEPGARVEARPGAYLSVGRDARILAMGTVLQPIVLTCTSVPRYDGCWEGLQIRGNARLNFGATTSPAARGTGAAGCRETMTGGLAYGGCDDADSSGVLQYVRVEYPNSGLQLLGVGSQTLIDYVQVNRSRRHGLQIVGGAAGVRRAFLTANRDYGLAWLGGWRGKAQQVVIQQDAAWQRGGVLASNAAGDDSTRFLGSPRSAPVLQNVTIVAPSISANPFHGEAAGVVLAGGTSGTLRNFLVYRAPIAFSLRDVETCIPFSVAPPEFTHVLVAGAGLVGDPDADPTCASYTSPDVEAQWIADPGNASRVLTATAAVQQLMIGPENLITPDARPRAASDAVTMPVAPLPADAFFQAAPYIGAVAPANTTMGNIPWYAGWTVPAPVPPAEGSVTGVVASATRGPVAGAVVTTSFGTSSAPTTATGSYSLLLPAGSHQLGASQLPQGCGVTGVTVTVPTGGTANADLPVTCTVVTRVAAATGHVCVATASSVSQCWGDNSNGALGNGAAGLVPVPAPVRVVTPFPISEVTSGYSHSCGLANGTALCWGANAFASLGTGSIGGFQSVPVPVSSGGVTFTRIAAGGYHTCALTAAGEAWCWGWNAEGQTGIGSIGSPVILPQRVQDNGLRFVEIAAGESHSCGLTAAGVAWCWGGNARGELGSDPAIVGASSPTPLLVPGGHTFASLDGGLLHTCGLSTVGGVWCWGDRTRGQVGDGVVGNTIASPTLVPGGRTYVHLSVGGETSCAVEAVTFQSWCWGRGDFGSLGDGTTVASQPSPVAAALLMVAGPVVGLPRVDVGHASGVSGSPVCAINTAGEVWCWGPGAQGQLGDGTLLVSQPTPRQARILPP